MSSKNLEQFFHRSHIYFNIFLNFYLMYFDFLLNALSLFRYNIRSLLYSLRNLALYNFYNTKNVTVFSTTFY